MNEIATSLENSPNLTSLLIGIGSSIIATAILYGTAELFRRVILPWIADSLYKGVRIDGNWKYIPVNAPANSINLTLNQSGERLTGTLHCSINSFEATYNLSGLIRNGFFTATAIPVSNKMIDAASLLLHVGYEQTTLILNGALLVKTGPAGVKVLENLNFIQNAINYANAQEAPQ
ncbi:hypothetical protein [Microbulbifer sp. MCCC 1A16149]|uniref:hypothetical protein n=1 Tax=Microbulbifer sp. MCCC 1A16149 TaxID=3411322 RepID=UPI003D098A83